MQGALTQHLNSEALWKITYCLGKNKKHISMPEEEKIMKF